MVDSPKPGKENFWNLREGEKGSSKRHFVAQRGEIESLQLFRGYSNVVPEDRILKVNDILGAEPNTLMSQAVRNRLIAKNLREERGGTGSYNSSPSRQEDVPGNRKSKL